ncbi:MAG: hypothetical protein JJ899_11905 [Alphaproteobacteria bacterium]|nr:hypothetical protein [Alphaproteobacteria bacterium]
MRAIIPALALLAASLAATPAAAQDGEGAQTRQQNPSGLPIPRWVSVRAGEANLRTGPGARYPIDWVLQRKDLPVEVVEEFENWRKIRAPDETVGWVHKSMLSGNRTATVAVARARVLSRPEDRAPIAAFVEEGVQVKLEFCEAEWCAVAIESHGVEGWIPRAALWGLHDGEVVVR